LLDQLLDEADALGCADSVDRDEHFAQRVEMNTSCDDPSSVAPSATLGLLAEEPRAVGPANRTRGWTPAGEGSDSSPVHGEASLRQPEGGELRPHAMATRPAFDRADALVAVAQGYLRGDRPARSPVEVRLIVSRASLTSGVPDPVEVGQIGDAFVSIEAAR